VNKTKKPVCEHQPLAFLRSSDVNNTERTAIIRQTLLMACPISILFLVLTNKILALCRQQFSQLQLLTCSDSYSAIADPVIKEIGGSRCGFSRKLSKTCRFNLHDPFETSTTSLPQREILLLTAKQPSCYGKVTIMKIKVS
jgi:hypothetical protein